MNSDTSGTGAVIIGRNEGERLETCLRSVRPQVGTMVYVDSGSTDASLETARKAGATVVELDMSLPFTAGRARNAGVRALLEIDAPEYVQFVDGDCELARGWVGQAQQVLQDHPEIAAVQGRLRERHPERSIYNQLCEWEWQRPVGESRSIGGIALVRMKAFDDAGGFIPHVIAGEEPELCVRLRKAGWKIRTLEADMAVHDAAMTRFSQWWTRTRRAGHAYAEGASLHGAPPERHYAVEQRRAILWGGVLPIAIVLGMVVSPWALLGLLAYPLQVLRLIVRGMPALRAFFTVLARFAEFRGVVGYHLRRLRNTSPEIIEYK